MRIAGGEWRGRNLKSPKGDLVRPTQDRVREALFSMLQNDIPGAKFLDVFAGSGAVGLEALSRGASHATFVEQSSSSLACIKSNIEMVKCENRTEVIRSDAYSWLKTDAAGRSFDIAFADPPYALGHEQGYAEILNALAVHNVVRPGGLFIAEMKRVQDPDTSEYWDLCRDRIYGQTRVAVYKRKEA
jgi:16S rRNA (guanine966-N2)-methyltransferase